MMRFCLLIAVLAACKSAPERVPPQPLNELEKNARSTKESDAYVQSLREEYRALNHVQSLLGWYVATQGETSLQRLTYIGHDRLFRKTALDAVAAARAESGLPPNESLALQFLRRSLASETVGLAVVGFDDEYADTEAAATVTLPWKDKPVAFRDMSILIGQEPDPQRRQQAYAALTAVRVARLNPILVKKEEAAQKAARESGFADYVALSEELRAVKLDDLLVQGVAYVHSTDAVFREQLDRIAREELGIPREKLRVADLTRLWKAPALAKFFDNALTNHGKLQKTGTTTVNGVQVVGVKDTTKGGILYVATSGKPYPIEVTEGGTSGGVLKFDQWNQTVKLTAPPNAVDISKLKK